MRSSADDTQAHAGVDKDKVNHNGATSLWIACQRGHLEVAGYLCDARVDKDKAMFDGALEGNSCRTCAVSSKILHAYMCLPISVVYHHPRYVQDALRAEGK